MAGRGRRGEPAMAVSSTISLPDEPSSHGHQRPTALGSSPRAASENNMTSSRAASTLSQPSSCQCPPGKGASKQHPSPKPSTASTTNNPRWYEAVTSWLSVSEPSARALKHQRVSAYQRHGIHPADPDAAAKMHLPVGKLPDGVTTSTAGPDPEEALRERGTRDASKLPFVRHGASQSRLGEARA